MGRVPGVAGDLYLAEVVGGGVVGHAEFGRGGAADGDEAGGQGVVDQRVVGGGDEAFPEFGAAFLHAAGHALAEVLDEDGDAVEHAGLVGMVGVGVGNDVVVEAEDGVELRIDAGDAFGDLGGDFLRG